ncbi:SDR family oxidoreductase [Novosphingobium sp.]|uniref:SDR family oxidoreductase n=1 Tax=Novosphingobium sp. TaxID=1874826 RepID=UPI0038BAC749|nr:SDR family oxidoreductase [Pseudomonadota bacterium]
MTRSTAAIDPASDAHTQQPTLEGRRVLITGGTTGIGRATAILLASAGCKVFICGRDEGHLADALERIGQVGTGDGMAIDLIAPSAVETLFDAAEKAWGGLDVAIVNAALPASDLAGTAPADLEYLVGVDFTAYLRTAREAAVRLGAGSDIVLVGSMSAVSQRPGSSVYVAAKTGIEGLAPALRKELAEKDIKVGLVEPGFTGADFQYPEFPPERQRALIHEHKMLRAEDIAVAIHYMLTQPRRCAVSLMRVETRLAHP